MRLSFLTIVLAACGVASSCGGGGGGGGGDGGGSGGPPVLQASLPFYNQALNADTATTSNSITPGFGGSYTDAGWDVYFANNSSRPVKAVLFQNDEIYHLLGRTFDSVTAADAATAAWATGIVDEPFDANRVVLVRTDTGAVFKLGNASENMTTVSFDYQLLVP